MFKFTIVLLLTAISFMRQTNKYITFFVSNSLSQRNAYTYSYLNFLSMERSTLVLGRY